MGLPNNIVKAAYQDCGVAKYKGNPFIEALPPIMSVKQIKKGLMGVIEFDPKELFVDGRKRAHVIASLLDDFFQPLASHLQLEEKISIMIRQGYVGRNLEGGSLNSHMQNGYERLMTGDLETFRFDHAKSTALSLSLIGCSGSGKSSTLSRVLSTYPQVIFHEKYNFTQVSYLKVDCPHDGSLKSLCIQFFRALDQVLQTDYETKYARKKNGIETLLALMSQVANTHAIGVLVIDEIQHLSRGRSGGIDKMLNFFVTLVNVIGLPVILVGTPKARPIFETDLRSARRGAGFGSLLWEPMKAQKPQLDPNTGKPRKTEWLAFTDTLWKYQWLQKRDEILSDEVRDCWYDLSQGVLDIVVKLFVLSQLRAIATKVERITPKLLQRVYEDELQPVHPMLSALRSGDPEKIAHYSDLIIPNIDKKILDLRERIEAERWARETELERFSGNAQAERLYNLLVGMDCDSSLIVPMVKRAFELHPNLTVRELIPVVLEWYERPLEPIGLNQKVAVKKVSRKNWHTLESDDLRFKYSQAEGGEMYEKLKKDSLIFNVDSWMRDVG
jgi:hypothetical protein